MWYMRTFYQMLLRDLKDDGDSAVQQVHILCACCSNETKSMRPARKPPCNSTPIFTLCPLFQDGLGLGNYTSCSQKRNIPEEIHRRSSLFSWDGRSLHSQGIAWHPSLLEGLRAEWQAMIGQTERGKKKVISYLKYPTDSAPLAAPPAPDRLCSFQIPWARRSGEQLATWCH